jgi:predicted nucleotidyltransferase
MLRPTLRGDMASSAAILDTSSSDLRPSGPVDEALRAVLARFPGLKLAIVYGSLASGRARPHSDLDLAVQADRPLSAEEKSALVEAVAGVAKRPVDLVDLSVAGEPTLGQVVRHGRRLLGSSDAHAALIYRHLVDQADFVPLRNRILDERRAAWIRT